MTVEELKEAVADGAVDTVLLAIADMEGRLQGKRLTATHFLGDVLEHGAEGCNYLLAVDVDMNTVGGYEISSWERGYGDFVLQPDLSTLRLASWLPATATNPSSAAASTWRVRICRGDCRTGCPSSHSTSHCTIAVAGSHDARRRVDRSGCSTKSP